MLSSMRVTPLLLTVSLVANVALATAVVLLRAPADTTAARGMLPVEPRKASPVPKPGEPRDLQLALKEAGVEPEIIRDVLAARIRQRYDAQRRALTQSRYVGAAWWKLGEDSFSPARRATRLQLRQLNEQMNAELESVLGPTPVTEPSPQDQLRYGPLPSAKIAEIRHIEQDYRDLIREIEAEGRKFQLPSDEEKIRFLQQEQARDLAATLTPEELQTYELRNSETAQGLRWAMAEMNPTEEEFRLVYQLQKSFDEAHGSAAGDDDGKPAPAVQEARQRAEEALDAQLKATLGPERFTEYKRAQDNDYRELKGAAERLSLPAEVPAKTYALRTEIPAEAVRIADNPALTVDQRQAALSRLASDARERLTQLYGADGAALVLKTDGLRWIKNLEEGLIDTFDQYGISSGQRSLRPE